MYLPDGLHRPSGFFCLFPHIIDSITLRKNKVMEFSFNSVEIIPDLKVSAAFTVNSSEVFRL